MINKEKILSCFFFIFSSCFIIAQGIPAKRKSTNIYVSTNFIYDLLGAPNLGFEYYLKPQLSLKIDAAVPWWSLEKEHTRYRIQNYKIALRQHFGHQYKDHISYGLIGGIYDLKVTKNGYKGEFLGLEIGYSHTTKINNHTYLEFGFGLGGFYTKYKKYIYQTPWYIYKGKGNKIYLGPTSVKISFVWKLPLNL